MSSIPGLSQLCNWLAAYGKIDSRSIVIVIAPVQSVSVYRKKISSLSLKYYSGAVKKTTLGCDQFVIIFPASLLCVLSTNNTAQCITIGVRFTI